MLAHYAQTAPHLCLVKSGFTTLVNKWALHIISTPCVLHWYALASKALPPHLKKKSFSFFWLKSYGQKQQMK